MHKKKEEINKRTLISLSMILAQTAGESSWGGAASDNAFLASRVSPSPAAQQHMLHEIIYGSSVVESHSFRSHKDVEEAAYDYAAYLVSKKGYSVAFKYTDDPISLAKVIRRTGMRPRQCGANLVSVILQSTN